MGLYINPPNESKEAFLRREAKELPLPPATLIPGKVIVCLVDNAVFKAAGVCFDQSELEAFAYPADGRRKQWYSIDREKLNGVCNPTELAFYLGE
jgi:hypothetical protein